MSVSANTLNSLYMQGILDYTPYELSGGVNVSSLNQGSNPYMQTAMQGNLYKNYGQSADSFNLNNTGFTQAQGINTGYSGQNYGTQSQGGINGFGNQGYGAQSQGGINGFGNQGYGTQSQGGINGFGNQGYGAQSQGGNNAFGAVNGNILSNDSQGGLNAFGGGFGKIGQTVSQTPSFIKGVLAGGIILGTTMLCLKRGKKPQKATAASNGLMSKIKFWKKK